MRRTGTGEPMWLTHHWPDQHDRCLTVGRTMVCRRCAVLYPMAVAVALVTLLVDPPQVAAVVAMWLLPLPMTLEWVAEHRGELDHSPRRLTVLTAVASLGIGVALAAHLRRPFDADALAPIATHATICGIAALRGTRHRDARAANADPGWDRDHERREAERAAALQRLLEDQNGESAATE